MREGGREGRALVVEGVSPLTPPQCAAGLASGWMGVVWRVSLLLTPNDLTLRSSDHALDY